MTADKFRSLALGISGAIESSHVDHPDFRIGGKVFASLGYPDDHHGMVKLSAGGAGSGREKCGAKKGNGKTTRLDEALLKIRRVAEGRMCC